MGAIAFVLAGPAQASTDHFNSAAAGVGFGRLNMLRASATLMLQQQSMIALYAERPAAITPPADPLPELRSGAILLAGCLLIRQAARRRRLVRDTRTGPPAGVSGPHP